MLIKRIYDTPEGWEPERNAEGNVTNAPPLKGVMLKHTGIHPEQNFSRRMIDVGVQEGWMSMSRGKLVVHTQEEDLEYTVQKMPGTYCCHCDMKLDDDPSGVSARQHIAERHDNAPSPDPANPAGYRVTNAYECVLDATQHAKWTAPAAFEAAQARYQHAMPPRQDVARNGGAAPAPASTEPPA